MAFIECRDLHFSYSEESGEVLHGVDLDIEKGSFVALLGHNGCGKSTMAKLFNGMLVPTSGTVTVDGIDTAVEETQLDVRRRVGLVQQNPDNQLVAGIVEEDVAFGPENLGIEPAEIRRRVDAALKAVNMYEYRDHAPHKLSGGTAQRLVNMEGYMPGREVVILGSGDIGLIMARRMTLEGAKVHVVAELQPYSGGLKRNIVQCLDDFGIPLKLSHTVTEIHGKDRVTGVTISAVDDKLKPIPGTEEYYSCDTLLLSVGLIPENELTLGAGAPLSRVTNGPVVNESLETGVPGIFACGNVLHVHDLVDYVSEEAAQAGRAAAKYVQGGNKETAEPLSGGIKLEAKGGVRYTVPSIIHPENMPDTLTVRFRVGGIYKNSFISVYFGDQRVQHRKKTVMAPGEMEQVLLKKADLQNIDFDTVTVTVEAE